MDRGKEMESNHNDLKDPIDPINILLVDDRPENLLVLEGVLQNKGYNLVKAVSGSESLRYLLEMEFALILLDVKMPEMDGFETAKQIRARDKTRYTPIIFITGIEKSSKCVETGYSLGAVDYLFKPIFPGILQAKVAVFVELYRKNREEVRARKRLADLSARLESSNLELEQFAYGVSHDLREPLRKIRCYSEMLEARYQGSLDERADKYIRSVVDGCDRMQLLLDGLLNYSRVTTQGKPFAAVDLNQVVEQAVAMVQLNLEEVGATVELKSPLPCLNGDVSQLVRVFLNLLQNSVRYRAEASLKIMIEVSRYRRTNLFAGTDHVTPAESDESSVHREQVGEQTAEQNEEKTAAPKRPHSGEQSEPQVKMWLIRVTDNGIGIDPKHCEQIFEIFQRLHSREQYPGEGIGLALCKRIIERHGGRIWAESEGENQGTSICFTLPVG